MSSGIEEVISALYEMVQDAWGVPLGADKCILERDKVLDLLDEINNQLPAEFKQAKTIVDARNEVITNAKREAESILKQAQQKAREMVAEDEIYRQAQVEAEKLLADTKAQADAVVAATQAKLDSMKTATLKYVLDSLVTTENAITGALKEVTDARTKFDAIVNPAPAEEPAPEEAPAEEAEAVEEAPAEEE